MLKLSINKCEIFLFIISVMFLFIISVIYRVGGASVALSQFQKDLIVVVR